jgi:hypothetical protein
MSRSMHFSWKGLILAPLAVPLIVSLLLTISSPGKGPFTTFLFFSAVGSVLSYGITVFLFLPSLFVVSRFIPLTASRTGLLGTALGMLIYIPYIWQSYRSSGDDSGPPQISFGEYLRHHWFAWDFWALLVAGLATAMLYWFLAKPSPRKDH